MAARLLLLGWAGADWQIIQPLLDAGRLPNLERLIQRGVMGKLVSVAPPHPAAMWTSLVTGRHADEHGVLAWTRPQAEAPGVRPVNSHDWQAPPLWAWVQAQGLAACAVGFPATHPATQPAAPPAPHASTAAPCVIVSDAFSQAQGADFHAWPLRPDAVSPAALADELAALRLHPADISAEQVLTFIPQAARIDQETDTRLAELIAALAETATVHSAATHLAEHAPWQLLAVHFDFIEKLSARFMAYRAPRMAEVSATDQALYGEVVDGAYQFMDLLLGRYLALIDAPTHVLIVSDHGFHSGTQRPAPTLRPDSAVAGVAGYRPRGILVAAGPQVRQDDLVFGAHLRDIAPTALHLLGLPVPEAMPGRVLDRMLLAPAPAPQLDQTAGAPRPVPPDHNDDDGAGASPWHDARWAASRLATLLAQGWIPPPGADPQHTAAHSHIVWLDHLAQAQISRRRHAQALETLAQLQALSPDRPATALAQAQCRFALNDLGGCRKVINGLVQSGYGGPAVDLLEAQIFLQEGKPDLALQRLQRAEAQGLDRPHLVERIGQAHLRLRRWAEAERCFTAALAQDPDHALALAGLGTARAAQGDPAGAVPPLMRSLSLQFVQPETHLHLGRCLAALGQTTQAQEAVLRALAQRPDFEAAHSTLREIQRSGVARALAAQRPG